MSQRQSEHYAAEDTERSWDIYVEIHEVYPDAIVIGGWGSWLHNKAAKSHDIDVIVSPQDLSAMRETLELTESHHLGSPEWRGTYDSIHLDVYVCYQSRLGQILKLPVEHLVEHRQEIDGYPTLNKEALLVAKAAARLDRRDTQPGQKDAEDMLIMLLKADRPWDFELVLRVAECSKSVNPAGPDLVFRAVEGLNEMASGRAVRRQLAAVVNEMRSVFERVT
ncbi:MAG: hypothetical protein WAK12_07625 [Acidimicrobiales bacterium]